MNEKLAELHRLLDEAYRHYFAYSDGHCKSSEGHITVHYGNFWDRVDSGPFVTGVEVYSYALGPSRSHWFDTLDAALAAVREWHAAEMASPCRECEGTLSVVGWDDEAGGSPCWLCIDHGRAPSNDADSTDEAQQ